MQRGCYPVRYPEEHDHWTAVWNGYRLQRKQALYRRHAAEVYCLHGLRRLQF